MSKPAKIQAVIEATHCDADIARDTLIADEWDLVAAIVDILAFEVTQ